MFKYIKLLLVLFLMLTIQVLAQENEAVTEENLEENNLSDDNSLNTNQNSNILYYAGYVEMIRNRIPEMKINATLETNAMNVLLSAVSINDVNLSAKGGAIGKFGSYGGQAVSANGFKLGVGAGSVISYSGTRWNIDVSQDALYQSKTPKGSLLVPSVTLSVTQPLLNNFLGTLDKYPIKDAEYALSISKLQREINDSSVMVSYKKMYFQWILLEKVLTYLDSIIKEAKAFENQTLRRYRSGLVDNDSYQNSIKQTLQYIQFHKQYSADLTNIQIAIDYFIPLEDRSPDQTTWNDFLDLSMNIDMDIVPFENTLHGAIAGETTKRAEYALSVMENNTLPSLDFVGSVGFANNDFGGNYFGSFGNMTNVDYFAGIKFSYPIGDKASKAKLNDAKNALYSVQADYDRLNMNFVKEITGLYNNFTLHKELLKIKQEEINAIDSRLNTQLSKLSQGRIEVDDIITTRLERVIAETELLDIQYNIITTVFDYRALLAME